MLWATLITIESDYSGQTRTLTSSGVTVLIITRTLFIALTLGTAFAVFLLMRWEEWITMIASHTAFTVFSLCIMQTSQALSRDAITIARIQQIRIARALASFTL